MMTQHDDHNNVPAEDAQKSVLSLIRDIQSGKADPTLLCVSDRHRCVEELTGGGYSLCECAEILHVSERTIARDRKSIRELNALHSDPAFVAQTIGALVREADNTIARIRQVTRGRETPSGIKIDGERTCWTIMRDLVQSLQQLGYLPSATQQIRGELTHKVVQVPPLEDLEADLDHIAGIVHRSASAGAEQLVIESVIDYYQRYTGKEARKHIEAVLDEQVGSDRQRIEKRKRACKKRLKEIEKITRNLLDNITETNRELVDQRLIELTAERDDLDQRLESLRFLTVTEQERKDLIGETMKFVPGLRGSLTCSSLDERQAAIRRCVDGMELNSDQLQLRIKIRKLPTVIGGSLTSETETIEIDLPTPPRRRKAS